MPSLKLTLIALSFLLLSSCTGSNSTQESLPPTEVDIPVSSTSSTGTLSTGTVDTTSTQSGNISSVPLSGNTGVTTTGQTLSAGTIKLIELQNEKGPNALLEVDCTKYDAEGKKFCTSQQTLIKKFNEETITWEETLKKGPNYIRTFDCMKITNEFGQKYCKEYQANIVVTDDIKK